MPSQTRKPQPRTDEDWEGYRALILKRHPERTAREVQAELKSLGFPVTKPQLRNRYIKWGLDDRYVRKDVAIKAIEKDEERKSRNLESIFEYNGRLLDMKDQKRYLKRNHLLADVVDGRIGRVATPPGLVCRTPSPTCGLRSPLHTTEFVLHRIEAYVRGSLDDGLWHKVVIEQSEPFDGGMMAFQSHYGLASDLLDHGYADKAKWEMELVVMTLERLSLTSNPHVLKQFFALAFGLCRDGHPDLVASMLDQVRSFAARKLAGTHPLTELFRCMCTINVTGHYFRETVSASWKCLSDSVQDKTSLVWDHLSDRLDYIMMVQYHENRQLAIKDLRSLNDLFATTFGNHEMKTLECKSNLAMAVIEFGQNIILDRRMETCSLIEEVLQSLALHEWTMEAASICCTARYVLYILSFGEGDLRQAEYHLWSAVQAILPLLGWQDTRIQWYLMKVMHVLCLQGEDHVARAIKKGMVAADRMYAMHYLGGSKSD